MNRPSFVRPVRRVLAALLAAFPLLAAPIAAQSVTFGALGGQVVDDRGRPVREAEVRIVDRASGAERTTQTDRDGRFRFGLLSAATYDVHAEAIGYRPVVHIGTVVAAGAAPAVRLALRAATPPVVTRDTVLARAATLVPLSWLVDRGYAEITSGRRLSSDVASLSPMADADGVEGLPWRATELVVDGARVGSSGQPASAGGEAAGLAVPLRGMATARAGGLGFDVEAAGNGVGIVGSSTRGGRDGGWWSLGEGGSAGLGGAMTVGGTVQRDTAHAIAGADYQRAAVARPALLATADPADVQIADVALAAHGVDLSAYTRESERLEERWSGHARFDWLQGDRFALSFRASGGRLVLGDEALVGGALAGMPRHQEATAGAGSVDLLSRLTDRLSLELRFSGDVSESSTPTTTSRFTSIASRGYALGGSADGGFSDSRSTPRTSAVLHADLGAHRLKAGMALALHRNESRFTPGSGGAFAFGDAVDLAALQGSYRAVSPEAGSSNFRMRETALFVQDAWAVTDALTLTAGLRMDAYRMPTGGFGGTDAWRAASGLADPITTTDRSRISPRVGFRWLFGDDRSWVLDGGAGVFNGLPDRRDLAEALALGRGAEVTGAVGALGDWPATPTTAASLGETVTLLGTRFEAPRTQRLALSLQRTVGTWTGYVSGVYRHTDFLTRRTDLNRPASPGGEDQYGRPLYGRLQQVGALVVAEAGSNRRFAGFDAVHALDVTGYSDFAAFSAGLDRVVDRGVSLALNYTYASTEDNLSGDGLARLAPFAEGFGGTDWADGTSDRSAPHRGLAAMEWSPSATGGLRLAVIYRVRSGRPFTPGFRAGVDANGDGDAYNDPAFVDAALPGMDALLDSHECLRTAAGRFAERNACRGDLEQRLDLRAVFRLSGGSGLGVSLVVDALDVVAAAVGRPDAALYLIDRTGTVSTDPLTGVTTVPLMVNPRFGEVLADRSPGALWRVGLRIGR